MSENASGDLAPDAAHTARQQEVLARLRVEAARYRLPRVEAEIAANGEYVLHTRRVGRLGWPTRLENRLEADVEDHLVEMAVEILALTARTWTAKDMHGMTTYVDPVLAWTLSRQEPADRPKTIQMINALHGDNDGWKKDREAWDLPVKAFFSREAPEQLVTMGHRLTESLRATASSRIGLIHWTGRFSRLVIETYDRYPQAVLLSLAGKPASDVIDHPAFADARNLIRTASDNGTSLCLEIDAHCPPLLEVVPEDLLPTQKTLSGRKGPKRTMPPAGSHWRHGPPEGHPAWWDEDDGDGW